MLFQQGLKHYVHADVHVKYEMINNDATHDKKPTLPVTGLSQAFAAVYVNPTTAPILPNTVIRKPACPGFLPRLHN